MKYSTIGERIRAARLSKGLTVPQLARRINVKVSTLNNWESDKSEPRANKLLALTGILNVSLIWLMEGGEGEGELPAHFDVVATADLQSKITRLQAMHERMVQLLFEISSEVNRVQKQIEEDELETPPTPSAGHLRSVDL